MAYQRDVSTAVRSLALEDKLAADFRTAIRDSNLQEIERIIALADPDLHKLFSSCPVLCMSCNYAQCSVTQRLLDIATVDNPNLKSLLLAETDPEGRTPLMIALKRNSADTVAILINFGFADAKVVDRKGKTALMYCRTVEAVNQIVDLKQDKAEALVNGKDSLGQTVLMEVLEKVEDVKVALHLIELGANTSAEDNEGRTALTTAMWKNRLGIIKRLAKNPQAGRVDRRERTSLHHLAADTERAETQATTTDESILKILLDEGAPLNDRDWLGRTPLAAALHSGNHALARLLMAVPGCRTDVETHAGWNMLHMACGSALNPRSLVETLIGAKLSVNSRTTLSQSTPLHIAAQSGNTDVLGFLLANPKVNRTDRDIDGNTPLFCAASHDPVKRAQIGKLFAPWNQWTLKHLAEQKDYERIKAATEAWQATVVDFDLTGKEQPLRKPYSVYDLINRPQADGVDSEPFFRTQPNSFSQSSSLRWIHLPANNISWCRDLITKNYIERECRDVQGFRDLERSLNNQNRGHEYHLHSRYMTPTCQAVFCSSTYAPKPARLPDFRTATDEQQLHGRVMSLPTSFGSDPVDVATHFQHGTTMSKSLSQASSTSSQDQGRPGKEEDLSAIGHIVIFMPYLHLETFADMIRMEKELDKMVHHEANNDAAPDDMQIKLFQAYLQRGKLSLHIRRTLDQFFYHNLSTKRRDRDQVVYRYQKKADERSGVKHSLQKILMVDQLWMWVIGEDLIITSFPHCWAGPDKDALDMFENIMEAVNRSGKDSIANIYQLAAMITSRFYGTGEGHGFGNDEARALEMFSSEIGDVMDKEVILFKDFAEAASKSKHVDILSYSDMNESFLNIEAETQLLKLVKDIRDELGMLKLLFQYQSDILPRFRDIVKDLAKQQGRFRSVAHKIAKNFDDHTRHVERPVNLVKTMDKQTERVYESIRDLLDLKQKHVNAVEARFAREQATSASQNGKTIMVFTIVTVFFLPLSFLAAFFAIPIAIFKRNGGEGDGDHLSLGYVAKWIFIVGMPLAVTCVIAALLVGPFSPRLAGMWQRSWIYQRTSGSKSWEKLKRNGLIGLTWIPGKRTKESDNGSQIEGATSSSNDGHDDIHLNAIHSFRKRRTQGQAPINFADIIV